jgi:vitamin B12/bleomycin/antimicrobial peptide transport system ATP-binding/permease protein
MADSYIEMGGKPEKGGVDPSAPPPLHATRGFKNQYQAFLAMSMPYFREERKARLMFGIMILLTLINSAVRVIFSYLARDFWTALSEERQDDFYTTMKQFVIAMIILAPINVLYRYQRQSLAIHWREWMTERVAALYFSNRVYYGIERSSDAGMPTSNDDHGNKSSRASTSPEAPVVVDNPDQRITEDVRSFTEFSLTLFLTILMSIVDLTCFSVILYTIMPQLFIAIASFAAFGTLMTMIIGRVLVQLNFEKLQKEATLRYTLVRVRENAESIAFLRGEHAERDKVFYRLQNVIANMHSLNAAVRNLDFFATYYDYLTWVLPILVVAPQYFAGEVELGVIQQARSAFSHVLDDMSIIVNQWQSLTEFGAGIDRLYTFLAVAQRIAHPDQSSETAPLFGDPSSLDKQPGDAPSLASGIQLQHIHSQQTAVNIQNLTLMTPNHNNPRTLILNLNLSVQWGQSLLICGTSGAGKSSLLRAIAGLWHSGSGCIQCPPDDAVYFLPQKPYCSLGSLRDQLLYPHTSHLDALSESSSSSSPAADGQQLNTSDSNLLAILRAVDLAELPQRAGGDQVNGLDAVMDWSNTLSLGEQQRLAFGRLLINKPRLVILDESTSALDIESERRMYMLLKNEVTYISVGHRPSLAEYHHTKVTLEGVDRCFVESLRQDPFI